MFPGFVITYKDKNNFTHLYFFRGIDDENSPIYNDIDISNLNIKYDVTVFNNYNKDYKFYLKNIVRINCKLIKKDNDEINITLNC